jgi:excisionase family DNA binding protein
MTETLGDAFSRFGDELETKIRAVVREEMRATPLRQLYTVKATAELLQLSESKVRRMIRLGEIQAERPDGRSVRIPHSELERRLGET